MIQRREKKARLGPPLRISLFEEDLELLKKTQPDWEYSRAGYARRLLSAAIRSAWAYNSIQNVDHEAAEAELALGFFTDLYHSQKELRAAAQEALRATERAMSEASEAAARCRRWLDFQSARRPEPAAAGLKVIDGKFGPAPKGSAS
jgi:hypothetical protein